MRNRRWEDHEKAGRPEDDTAQNGGGHRAPAVPLPGLQEPAPAGAEGAARHPAADFSGRHGTRLRVRPHWGVGRRPYRPARGRAPRGEDHRYRPRPRRGRASGSGRPRRGLAGERRGPLHPPEGPAPRPAGPELLRCGALPHRRRGSLPLCHGKARGVPVEKPRQRLAAGPRSLLGLRLGFQEPAHHPDVLPRRPALRARPHLPVRAGRAGTPAPRVFFRPRDHRARVGFRLPVRHRSRRPRGNPVREAARLSPQPTPSQTIGPFFHDALLEKGLAQLVSPDHPGAIKITGVVYDGGGEPVTDAMVEISQERPSGHRDDPNTQDGGFSDWGRSGTTDGGRFSFVTLKPAPVPAPDGSLQAPHVNVVVFARGLLRQAVTRMYFPDEGEANAADPVLLSIGDGALRETLVAREEERGSYRFDVRLQGGDQTAFFEFEG